MLGSSSYEFNNTMECRDRDSDSIGAGGYNNISLMRNGRGEFRLWFFFFFFQKFMQKTKITEFYWEISLVGLEHGHVVCPFLSPAGFLWLINWWCEHDLFVFAVSLRFRRKDTLYLMLGVPQSNDISNTQREEHDAIIDSFHSFFFLWVVALIRFWRHHKKIYLPSILCRQWIAFCRIFV